MISFISDIAKFEKKINDSHMNDEAKKEAKATEGGLS